MKIALLLMITMGVGYKVFIDATKEAGSRKTFGRLIGVVMLASSLCASLVIVPKMICRALPKDCPMTARLFSCLEKGTKMCPLKMCSSMFSNPNK